MTTPRLLNLTWGENAIREPGRVHIEWHAPCGCAYHPEPSPHVHQCQACAKPQPPPIVTAPVGTLWMWEEGGDAHLVGIGGMGTIPYTARCGAGVALEHRSAFQVGGYSQQPCAACVAALPGGA